MKASLYFFLAACYVAATMAMEYTPEFSDKAVDVDNSKEELKPCNSMCRDKIHEGCHTGKEQELVKPYTHTCSRASFGLNNVNSFKASGLANGRGPFGLQVIANPNTVEVTIGISNEATQIKFHHVNNIVHVKIFTGSKRGGEANFYEVKVSTPSPKLASSFNLFALKPYNSKFPYGVRLRL